MVNPRVGAFRTPFRNKIRDHDVENFRKQLNEAYQTSSYFREDAKRRRLRRKLPMFKSEMVDRILYYLDRDNNQYMYVGYA